MYQFLAFVRWMCRKTMRLPLVVFNQLRSGLQYQAKAIYEDGFVGVVLACLMSALGFMTGLVLTGVYLECVKEEGTQVHVEQVAFGGLVAGAVATTIIFFYTCWYCFKKEQEEIFNKLKDTHRG